MVPYLQSRSADGALAGALADPDPFVKRAAEWATEELRRSAADTSAPSVPPGVAPGGTPGGGDAPPPPVGPS
jgi:hypothetical protein